MSPAAWGLSLEFEDGGDTREAGCSRAQGGQGTALIPWASQLSAQAQAIPALVPPPPATQRLIVLRTSGLGGRSTPGLGLSLSPANVFGLHM